MRHVSYLMLLLVMVATAPSGGAEDAEEGVVRIANLVYADDKTGVCFADDFLETVARESEINIERRFSTVRLDSDELFDYPFAVMTGEGAFVLSEREIENLRDYVDRGGFLLASAGCSNAAWSKSFRNVMKLIRGDDTFEPITLEHAVFHSLHDIDRIDTKRPANDMAIVGLTRDDRLRVLFSPLGLNDTGNAGKGCCCCGGNEIRNARLINANIVAYALTH